MERLGHDLPLFVPDQLELRLHPACPQPSACIDYIDCDFQDHHTPVLQKRHEERLEHERKARGCVYGGALLDGQVCACTQAVQGRESSAAPALH